MDENPAKSAQHSLLSEYCRHRFEILAQERNKIPCIYVFYYLPIYLQQEHLESADLRHGSSIPGLSKPTISTDIAFFPLYFIFLPIVIQITPNLFPWIQTVIQTTLEM